MKRPAAALRSILRRRPAASGAEGAKRGVSLSPMGLDTRQ